MEIVPLADTYSEPAHNPAGMLFSEKLDGVRALWTGRELLTRAGNRIAAPAWWIDGLPTRHRFDGELWIGRGRFDHVSGVVRRKLGGPEWSAVAFMVFDAPDAAGGLGLRLAFARRAIGLATHARVIDHAECSGPDQLRRQLARVISVGGEGIMLRSASASWRPGRSAAWLKVKPRDESDGVVIGHVWRPRGTGPELVRALRCTVDDGTGTPIGVDVGTGLSELQRLRPPAVGCLVRIVHAGRTPAGVPRHPVFAGVRADSL
ncbi:MAG: DNA ligase [Phycisphaerae bacterium]|nr:DNA ligase [Phycisphaerae bacterium]